jgi:cyclopropane fatty-acyl-phospholipid synthase-like methyltransferase
MFQELEKINQRPAPFEFYTAGDLWTDEHTSKQMLRHHLDESSDVASRRGMFIERSAEWIASRFRVSSDTNICDFGCGPGLYTMRLARHGAQVTGIDFSPRSIRYAEQRAAKEGLSVRYVHQNYLDFETDERYDLITMITCDFCALSPAQRRRMLDKWQRFLKPGGHVLLDAYLPAAFEGREETARYALYPDGGFWSPNLYYEFVNSYTYEQEQVTLEKFTLVEADRVRTVYNWLAYFQPDQLKGDFGACGLEVAELYADVAGSPFDPGAREFAVVAAKPDQESTI